MAYDRLRGMTVMYGGQGEVGDNPTDTWELEQVRWRLRSPSENPGIRSNHSMANDAERGESVLFGGERSGLPLSDTWIWANGAWSQRPVAGPSARNYTAMAYDWGRHVVVLFGGLGLDGERADTWEWNGTEWTERQIPGPAARHGHAMTYDFARRTVVIFGGSAGARLDDMWEFDGVAWRQRLVQGPAARLRSCIASDPVRRSIVMFGGDLPGMIGSQTFPRPNNEMWELSPGCCRADWDCSGAVAIEDVLLFVQEWFAAWPSANFDGVNGLQVQDIFAFLSSWFAGC